MCCGKSDSVLTPWPGSDTYLSNFPRRKEMSVGVHWRIIARVTHSAWRIIARVTVVHPARGKPADEFMLSTGSADEGQTLYYAWVVDRGAFNRPQ
eukprot:gene5418-6570_t